MHYTYIYSHVRNLTIFFVHDQNFSKIHEIDDLTIFFLPNQVKTGLMKSYDIK
jgi:hypothetical protein